MPYKNKTTKTNETVILDTYKNMTQYYEFKALEISTLNSKYNTNSTYSYPFMKIKRVAGTSTNKNFLMLNNVYYVFESIDEIKWKIQSETKDYKGWKLQKAICYFGGRNWVAWFNANYPINEGPYKFNGLPGLIIQVYSTDKAFEFDLAEITKIEKNDDNFVENIFNMKPIPITSKQYQKLFMIYYNDPLYTMRQYIGKGSIKDIYGNLIDDMETYNKQNNIEKSTIKNRNYLEEDIMKNLLK